MPKVEILAQIFGVSLNVMKARLNYLKIDSYVRVSNNTFGHFCLKQTVR